jgi:acyl-CoA thioesterase
MQQKELPDSFRSGDDRFVAANGMRLVELRPGFAKTTVTVEERHLNSLGTMHGGAIFALADFAFGAVSNSDGRTAPAINTTISFLKAVRTGATLYAEATEVSRSRKLLACTVRVTNDAGELVALFQGTAYIKRALSLRQRQCAANRQRQLRRPGQRSES